MPLVLVRQPTGGGVGQVRATRVYDRTTAAADSLAALAPAAVTVLDEARTVSAAGDQITDTRPAETTCRRDRLAA